MPNTLQIGGIYWFNPDYDHIDREGTGYHIHEVNRHESFNMAAMVLFQSEQYGVAPVRLLGRTAEFAHAFQGTEYLDLVHLRDFEFLRVGRREGFTVDTNSGVLATWRSSIEDAPRANLPDAFVEAFPTVDLPDNRQSETFSCWWVDEERQSDAPLIGMGRVGNSNEPVRKLSPVIRRIPKSGVKFQLNKKGI